MSFINFKKNIFYYFLLISPAVSIAQERSTNPSDTTVVTMTQVTINANRFGISLANIPNRVILIGKNEIRFGNAQTTADMLANTGGVFVQKSQLGGGSPVLRGMEANRILLVVDNVRMNNAIFRGGHLQNALRMDNLFLDRTEVIFGPGSVIYGSDALGGVIHFNTLQTDFSEKASWRNNAFTRYSSANSEISAGATAAYSGKRFSSVTGIVYSLFSDMRQGKGNSVLPDSLSTLWDRNRYVDRINGKDSVISNSDPSLQVKSAYQQYNLMQKFAFRQNENTEHRLSFIYSATGDVPRYDRLTETASGKPRFAEWYYGPEKWFFGSYQLKHRNTAWYDEATLTAAYQQFQESRNSRRLNASERKEQNEQVHAYSLNADAMKALSKFTLRYGMEAVFNKINSTARFVNVTSGNTRPADTRYPSGNNTYFTGTVYGTAEKKLSQRLTGNLGIRAGYSSLNCNFTDKSFFPFPYDKATQNAPVYSANLGLNYLTPTMERIAATVSSGYRIPNADDMTKVFESAKGTVIVPNPDLKPENVVNFDLTLQKAWNDKAEITLTGWYSMLSNAISAASSTFNGQDSILYDGTLSRVVSNQNLDKGSVMGGTFQAGYRFNRHWILRGTVTYTYGRITSGGTTGPLDHIPPMYGSASVHYRFFNKWEARFYVMFNGTKNVKDYRLNGEDNIQYATPNGMPGWYTLNLKGEYHFGKNLSLQAGIENITDLQYRTFSSGISAAGRNFIVALRGLF